MAGRADTRRGQRRAGRTLRLILLIFAIPDGYNFTRGQNRVQRSGTRYGCAEYRECQDRITESQYLAYEERGMSKKCSDHGLPMTTEVR